MFKDMPMEITWAEAKKIFDTNIAIRGGGGGVLSYGGKWYDVRHMSARHARRQALTDMPGSSGMSAQQLWPTLTS